MKRIRKFGGKAYHFDRFFPTKREAGKRAKDLRDSDYFARVASFSNGYATFFVKR